MDTTTTANTKKPFHLSRSLTYHHSTSGPAKRRRAHHHLPVILYSTSLRGVRRTFVDCCAVRAVLRGFRVAVDERDVSMDSSLRREVQSLLAAENLPFSLPQLVVGGRLVGGAEAVRHLVETGSLGVVLEGAAGQDPAFVCDGCGGARFVLCTGCGGGRKVFDEEERRARRCEECNENGLVRCANCCFY